MTFEIRALINTTVAIGLALGSPAGLAASGNKSLSKPTSGTAKSKKSEKVDPILAARSREIASQIASRVVRRQMKIETTDQLLSSLADEIELKNLVKAKLKPHGNVALPRLLDIENRILFVDGSGTPLVPMAFVIELGPDLEPKLTFNGRDLSKRPDESESAWTKRLFTEIEGTTSTGKPARSSASHRIYDAVFPSAEAAGPLIAGLALGSFAASVYSAVTARNTRHELGQFRQEAMAALGDIRRQGASGGGSGGSDGSSGGGVSAADLQGAVENGVTTAFQRMQERLDRELHDHRISIRASLRTVSGFRCTAPPGARAGALTDEQVARSGAEFKLKLADGREIEMVSKPTRMSSLLHFEVRNPSSTGPKSAEIMINTQDGETVSATSADGERRVSEGDQAFLTPLQDLLRSDRIQPVTEVIRLNQSRTQFADVTDFAPVEALVHKLKLCGDVMESDANAPLRDRWMTCHQSGAGTNEDGATVNPRNVVDGEIERCLCSNFGNRAQQETPICQTRYRPERISVTRQETAPRALEKINLLLYGSRDASTVNGSCLRDTLPNVQGQNLYYRAVRGYSNTTSTDRSKTLPAKQLLEGFRDQLLREYPRNERVENIVAITTTLTACCRDRSCADYEQASQTIESFRNGTTPRTTDGEPPRQAPARPQRGG